MSAAECLVLAENLAFPEGPAFAPDGSLWWVEIEGGCLGRLHSKRRDRLAIGGRPNGLAFDQSGKLWICDQGERSIRMHDPATGETSTIVDAIDGEPLGKPNDLAFDAAGNLLFTCPNDARTEPVGYLCCLAPGGGLTRVADDLYFPNGLAFTPDGEVLVVAETYRQRLWKGAWDASARRWCDPQPWAEITGPTGPDGLAFAKDGSLTVAVFGQGTVSIVGEDGQVRHAFDVPGQRPTNLAFDPCGRLGLVVTEAEHGRILSYPAFRSASVLFPRFAS